MEKTSACSEALASPSITCEETFVDNACRRFEMAWRQGAPQPIERFLPPEDQAGYLPLLVELVHIEMEFAWKAAGSGGSGDAARVETYVARFRRLDEPATVLDLLRQEFTLRSRHAESPSVEEYRRRFPGLLVTGIELQDLMAGTLAATPADEDDEGIACLSPPQEADELGRLGSYRILKVLGQGGMGIVFLAEDLQLRRPVALKTMRPSLAAKNAHRQRFLREARLAAAVNHDHIVSIYQVGEDHGVPYLAMPLLEGESLEDRLRQRAGPWPVSEALQIGRQIAEGLAAAHARGLIHRDIKPANVWLEDRGQKSEVRSQNASGFRVKILDFGLARADGDDGGLTQSGDVLGTPAYMAPEQARGEKVDGRCDLFSLGCVLYRLLAGRPPFSGTTMMGVLMALGTETPPPVAKENPAVPPAVSDLVMRLLAKDPAARLQSAAETAQAIDALEVCHLAPRGELTSRSDVPHWRLAAVLLIALIPLGWFYGPAVIRYASNRGELVVETDDPNVEVTIRQGELVLFDKTRNRTFELRPGNGEVDVYEPASGMRVQTKKFTLGRGGQEVVRVRLEATPATSAPPTVGANVDRVTAITAEIEAAKWVLSIGGKLTIRVADEQREIVAASDLPADAVTVVEVDLRDNEPLADEALARLQPLIHLEQLNLYRAKIGDAGAAHLARLTNLRGVSLRATKVGDAGLMHLAALHNLVGLNVAGTPVSDAGLAHLKSLPNLFSLDLAATQITDAGLEHLAALPKLAHLNLMDLKIEGSGLVHLKNTPSLLHLTLAGSSRLTDEGVATLRNATNLAVINLDGTNIGDAGVAQLATLPNVWSLWLAGTQVTDAGLQPLHAMNSLSELNVTRTKVTADGVAALQKARPQCRIIREVPQ